MGNQQPGVQAPMPDHRINEIMEEMRKLRDQNNQLRGHIDMMSNQMRQPAPAPEVPDNAFTPDVNTALERKIKAVAEKMLAPVVQKTEQFNNYIGERNDLIEFQQRWGVKNYDENKDKIEQLRQEKRAQGQWLTREEAYKFVKFEENQKKPQPKPEPGLNSQPVYDPYLQKYVLPDGSQAQGVQVQTNELPPPVPQTPGTQQMQIPNPTNQQTPPPQVNQNQGNEDFGLPPDSFNVGVKGQAAGATPVDLMSDEKALDAWAQKYGDQPL